MSIQLFLYYLIQIIQSLQGFFFFNIWLTCEFASTLLFFSLISICYLSHLLNMLSNFILHVGYCAYKIIETPVDVIFMKSQFIFFSPGHVVGEAEHLNLIGDYAWIRLDHSFNNIQSTSFWFGSVSKLSRILTSSLVGFCLPYFR